MVREVTGLGSITAGGPDNTNVDLMINLKICTLREYTRVPKLFLCPASVVLAPVNPGTPSNVSLFFL